MIDISHMKEPTYIFHPFKEKRIVEAEEVKGYLEKGWAESPADFKKEEKKEKAPEDGDYLFPKFNPEPSFETAEPFEAEAPPAIELITEKEALDLNRNDLRAYAKQFDITGRTHREIFTELKEAEKLIKGEDDNSVEDN